MRIECTQCKELFDADTASVIGAEVRIACTKCDASLALSLGAGLASEASSATLPERAGDACPKCAAPANLELAACASCGLATSLFAAYQAEEGHDDHAMEAAWQKLNANWDSDEQHEAFMRHVASSGDFRGGAARYRVSQRDSSRAERSTKMLNRIQSMASAALLATKPKLAKEKEPFKGAVVLLVFMVTLAAVGGMYAYYRSLKEPPKRKNFKTRSPVLAPTPSPTDKGQAPAAPPKEQP